MAENDAPERDDLISRNEQQARKIIKRISDAAIELAFVRHGLTSDEVDVDEDTPPRIYAELHDDYCERIKEDTLACLTGDDTGCLDPEELDESNCELLWTQSLLNRVASEAATQGQAEKDAEIDALKYALREAAIFAHTGWSHPTSYTDCEYPVCMDRKRLIGDYDG